MFISIVNGSQIEIKRINQKDGLSQNWVRCIYQDKIGYIWFGTSGALNRYDGYKCKVFNIGNGSVNTIVQKDNDELWIGSDLGIYTFNIITEKLTLCNHLGYKAVFCILNPKDRFIWFGSNNGYYKYDTKKQQFENYLLSQNARANYINALLKDSKGNVWFGTKNGLYVLKDHGTEYISYSLDNSNMKNSNNEIYCIKEDDKHRLWVGSLNGGLQCLPNAINSPENSTVNTITTDIVYDILINNQNTFWFATNNGLGTFNLNDFIINKTPSIYYFKNEINNSKSLSENVTFSLFEDNMHDMWVGTMGSGVNIISFRGKQFNIISQISTPNSIMSNLVNCFYEDDKYLWIGTELGLDRYNKQTKTYKHYASKITHNSNLNGKSIFAFKKDSQGKLWIGTWSGGISVYDYKTDSFTEFYPDGNENSLNNENVFALAEDKNKNMWIGTIGGGINKYNYKSKTFKHYVFDNKNPHSIRTDYINSILVTSDGHIFIADYHYLEEYDEKIDGFTSYKIKDTSLQNVPYNYIYSLFEDSKHHVWLSTCDGLQYFDRNTKTFTTYLKTKTNVNNTIVGIEEDSKANLWLSTNNGIIKFINGANLPKKAEYQRFTQSDGIAGNECKRRSIYKNKNGILYVGSSLGYTFFNPDSIKLNPYIPIIAISELKLLSALPNENASYKSLDINPNKVNTVTLSYKNSNFIIDFAALNYLSTENNRYKYMLEGYDSEWIDAGGKTSASYTNTQPGNYIFKIIASNNDGLWTPHPKYLTIIITPPWWNTLLFRILCVIIFFAAIYFIFKIRLSFLQKQKILLKKNIEEKTYELKQSNNSLKEKQVEIDKQNNELQNHRINLEKLVAYRTIALADALDKATENDRLKTAFLHNISHEIRTPMNAIMGFSSFLKNPALEREKMVKFVDIITDSSSQLLSIITDIINIATIEAGKERINIKEFNLNALLTSIYHQFGLKVADNPIQLQYEFGLKDEYAKINTDETKVIEIISNLIANAVKFTDKGHVLFGYNVKGYELEFFVEDTGIGISNDKFDLIFERFRQVDSNSEKLYGGTGLGLSISKNYVELLGGKIWLKSELDKGSKFYFTLPFTGINETSLIDKSINDDLKAKSLKTILIAEDEDINYVLLEEYFSSLPIDIVRAKNGKEAIAKCKEQRFDLILMDLKMPILNGIEATKQIKELYPDIKIIAQTAYIDRIDLDKALESGMVDCLIKPIGYQKLVDILNIYLV